MPRQEIDLPNIEHLSILDEDGNLDKDLLPDLDEEFLRKLHRYMLLSRRFDERLLQLQRQGRIGTFAPAMGQEASMIGSVAALEERDWVVPSYREQPVVIWRGIPLSQLLLYVAGFNEGAAIPEDAHDLPITIPIAAHLPLAAGLGYAAKYRDTDEVVIAYFGDGATSEGDFHEAVNVSGVHKLPIVWLCQNNHWAISVPLRLQTESDTFAQKALAYGIPGIQVDGNDIFAVYKATSDAVERARSGEGPTLIECITYRMSMHTTADDPSKYREDEDVEEWEERDPIDRLQDYLIDQGVLSQDDIDEVEEEIEEQIQQAWEEAQEQMEELGEQQEVMFDHVYAERHPYLEAQREAFPGDILAEGMGDG